MSSVISPGQKMKERGFQIIIYTLVILFLGLADFIVGTLYTARIPGVQHHYYNHGLDAKVNLPWKYAGLDYRLITNSLGFRDFKVRDVPLDDPTKYRLVITGDSFTEGVGYFYDKIFSGVFTPYFDESKIEILNAGAQSYSPRLHYLKMKYFIEQVGLKFDELIVFIDASDPFDEIRYDTFNPSLEPSLAARVRYWFHRHSILYRLFLAPHLGDIKDWLRKWSEQLLSRANASTEKEELRAKARMEKLRQSHSSGTIGYIGEMSEMWTPEGFALAEKHMDLLTDLCKKHQIKLSIAVYPWPEQIRNKNLDSKQVTFWKAYAEKRALGFLNFFPEFIGPNHSDPQGTIQKYFISGDVHWNDTAHKLIGEKLVEYRCPGGKKTAQANHDQLCLGLK